MKYVYASKQLQKAANYAKRLSATNHDAGLDHSGPLKGVDATVRTACLLAAATAYQDMENFIRDLDDGETK